MDVVVDLVEVLVQGLIFAIFIRAIISWFPVDHSGPLVRALDSVTEPILDPMRRLIPRIGAIDISPMIAIIVLYAILSVIQSRSVA